MAVRRMRWWCGLGRVWSCCELDVFFSPRGYYGRPSSSMQHCPSFLSDWSPLDFMCNDRLLPLVVPGFHTAAYCNLLVGMGWMAFRARPLTGGVQKNCLLLGRVVRGERQEQQRKCARQKAKWWSALGNSVMYFVNECHQRLAASVVMAIAYYWRAVPVFAHA
jgi:hypothetical protein